MPDRAFVVEALVLCGGLGLRLRPAVADRPKVLADVQGRPFLSYVLHQLAQAGVRRAILCTGYGAERIAHDLGPRHGALTLAYAPEESPLGTAGALRAALPQLRSDRALVANGDSILSAPLAALVDHGRRTGHGALVALAEVPDAGRYGRVVLGPDDRIRAFEEKAPDAGAGLVNAGVYLLDRQRLEALPETRPLSLERDVFPRWIEADGLWGWRSGGQLLDIGVPEAYATASRFLADAGLS